MNFKMTQQILIILLAGLFFTGCLSSGSTAEKRAQVAEKATGEIVIGVVGPWDVSYGLVKDGVKMAADEINRAGGLLGGRKLKIIAKNDQRSIDAGQIIAQQFAENIDMVAVIGHVNSSISIPTSIMYQYYGMVMLSPLSTNSRLTHQGYDKVFRNVPNNAMFGRSQAEFCSRKGFDRIMIYHLNDDYAQDLSNAFEIAAGELGLTIVDRLSYDALSDVRHFKSDLEYWKDTFEFDAIFLAGLMPQAAGVVADARKLGIEVPIIGGDALNTSELFTEVGDYAEGVYSAAIYHLDNDLPKNREFVLNFKKCYARLPDRCAAQGYDAMQVLAAAITKANSSVPDKIARALHELDNYEGLTGAYSFDDNGDVNNRPIFMLVAREGRFEIVKK